MYQLQLNQKSQKVDFILYCLALVHAYEMGKMTMSEIGVQIINAAAQKETRGRPSVHQRRLKQEIVELSSYLIGHPQITSDEDAEQCIDDIKALVQSV